MKTLLEFAEAIKELHPWQKRFIEFMEKAKADGKVLRLPNTRGKSMFFTKAADGNGITGKNIDQIIIDEIAKDREKNK